MTTDTPLPTGWAWTTLGEITLNFDGRRVPVKAGDRDKRAGQFPYYGASGVIDTIDDYIFDGEYLLVAEDGANLLSRSTPIAFRATGQFWVNNHAHVVQLREGMPLKFLEHYLNSINLQFYVTGTAQPKLNQVNLNKIRCPLPPLPEQQRIVEQVDELLSDLDAGVAALERARANLKKYRAAVLKAAVTGDLTADWRAAHPTVEPAAKLLDRILAERRRQWEADQQAKFAASGKAPPGGWLDKYSTPTSPQEDTLYSLPTGWKWATALQVCERVESGSTPAADKMTADVGEVPFIKVYNLTTDGRLNFAHKPTFVSSATHVGQLARSRVLPGDVLMNIVGPPLGKVSLVPDAYPEWNMNQAVVLFRPVPGLLNRYLMLCLLSEEVLDWITQQAKATAGQFNISVSMSRELPIPLPPAAEQAVIVAEAEQQLSGIDAATNYIHASLKRAGQLRQSILKEAFAGRLVPQDPNDEPASVLLDRIRQARLAANGSAAVTRSRRSGRTRARPGDPTEEAADGTT